MTNASAVQTIASENPTFEIPPGVFRMQIAEAVVKMEKVVPGLPRGWLAAWLALRRWWGWFSAGHLGWDLVCTSR